MPINTANKRMSCLGLALPFAQLIAEADGTIGRPDQQSALYCYAGIEFLQSLPARVGGGGPSARRRRRDKG